MTTQSPASRSPGAQGEPAPQEAAVGVHRIDVTPVNAAANRKLYKAREPIYPKLVHGPFRAFKWVFLAFSLLVYYGIPWVRWPRAVGEPDQAVLVDFEGRRFYFFFIEIWPQEVYYITGLLIIAALSLFLVTSLFGRVWCGYACPQTIWTDLFIAVERFFEGDRNQRMRLDKAKWSPNKLARKLGKHIVWLLIAFATGGAWILYFHDAPSLARDFFLGQAPATAYIFAGILTFTTYSLAGMMREQVCTYMCPWPRIQGAMTDNETLEVTYRAERGEPRGPHRRGESWDGRGDCIDCKQCVAACPMGIDIRDGDQLECINCALCIDACDAIMVKIERPKGLIAYDSRANTQKRLGAAKRGTRILRPRTIYYAVALALVSVVMLVAFSSRSTIDLNVLRDRNPNYVQLSDGSVRNGYTVKIINKNNTEQTYRLTIDGPAGLSVSVVGAPDAGPEPEFTVGPDQVGRFRVYVTLPREALTAASLPLTFTVSETATQTEAVNPTMFQTGVGQ